MDQESLKHASKKLINLNQKFSHCEESLRESDLAAEKVKSNLMTMNVENMKNVSSIGEVSTPLETLKQLISRFNESMESLELESNIMKTDISSIQPAFTGRSSA